jgi:hypothetical protein
VKYQQGKTTIAVEEIGGFAGYSSGSHVRTRGEVELEGLPDAERVTVEQLLKRGRLKAEHPGPRYLLSWEEKGEPRQAEVSIDELTPSLRASLKTDLV